MLWAGTNVPMGSMNCRRNFQGGTTASGKEKAGCCQPASVVRIAEKNRDRYCARVIEPVTFVIVL